MQRLRKGHFQVCEACLANRLEKVSVGYLLPNCFFFSTFGCQSHSFPIKAQQKPDEVISIFQHMSTHSSTKMVTPLTHCYHEAFYPPQLVEDFEQHFVRYSTFVVPQTGKNIERWKGWRQMEALRFESIPSYPSPKFGRHSITMVTPMPFRHPKAPDTKHRPRNDNHQTLRQDTS